MYRILLIGFISFIFALVMSVLMGTALYSHGYQGWGAFIGIIGTFGGSAALSVFLWRRLCRDDTVQHPDGS